MVKSLKIQKINQGKKSYETDLLAVEEPLEIRLGFGKKMERNQKSISVTMRTPGNDFELVLGFLFTEGILQNKNQILKIDYCKNVKLEEKQNVIRVELKENIQLDFKKLERHFYTNSSCGVCGKSSIESIENIQKCSLEIEQGIFYKKIIHQLPEIIRQKQIVFNHTGGLHASALFDKNGKLLLLKEDIGRHNALDKIIGKLFWDEKIPLKNSMLFLSGRASFELIQKAIIAGISLVAAVGAPSSLAVDLAREYKLTLLGFLRNDRFNIYSGEERINF